jgi:phage gp36-like protein
MSYCSRADLEKAIEAQVVIDLTDDERAGATNTEIETRVADACARASKRIDGFLRGRYAVPISPVPQMIRAIAVDLAIHRLFSRRPAIGIPETVRDNWKAAEADLVRISKGELDLGDEPPPAKSSAIVAEADGPDRLFTQDTLKEM